MADVTPPVDVEAIVDDTRALVEVESPSSDVEACRAAAHTLAGIARRRLPSATATVVEAGERPHVVIRCGPRPRVLLLGHLDTVFPLGTLARRPFSDSGGLLRGPGVFDMKAALAVGLATLAALGGPDGAAFLVTSDEEVGSAASVELLQALAAEAGTVLILEPPMDGPAGHVKIGRARRSGAGGVSRGSRGR